MISSGSGDAGMWLEKEGNEKGGICSIFLSVDRSINEIHKPRILNTIEVFYKKYVFLYY
jgi:hypothetical protein